MKKLSIPFHIGEDRRRVVFSGEIVNPFVRNRPTPTLHEQHAENFNIADIYEEREVEEEGQIYYSSDSDNLAIQLDHVITSTEETELLLAQAQAEREIGAQKGQSIVKNEHLAPVEHSYSNSTPATITRAPTFALPNSKGKKRGLRRPKIEIVETHSLFEDSENIAPAKPLEQLPVKSEQLPPPS